MVAIILFISPKDTNSITEKSNDLNLPEQFILQELGLDTMSKNGISFPDFKEFKEKAIKEEINLPPQKKKEIINDVKEVVECQTQLIKILKEQPEKVKFNKIPKEKLVN